MPYSTTKTIPALSNKSDKVKEVFAEAANSALARGLTDDEAIYAGLSAVSNYEKKHQVKKEAKPAKKLPSHLAVILETAEVMKQQKIQDEIAKAELEAKQLQALQDKIQEEIKASTANTIVDMQVLGEDVLLVYKDGRKVKRKLADYTINQQVTVTGAQEPTFTNTNPSIAVGGIPSGSTFVEQDMQSMFNQLLYPFSVALAASPNLVEIGTVLNGISLSWNSSIPDANFELNQGIGDVTGSTSYVYTDPVSSNITFTLTAVSGGMTRVSNAQVQFKNRVITAPTANTLPDETELLAAGGILSDSFVRTATYDCTGGRRPYIAYPTRLGVMTTVTVNNLVWNDYTTTTVSHTNANGYTEDYYVLVSNNILYGSSVTIKWGG